MDVNQHDGGVPTCHPFYIHKWFKKYWPISTFPVKVVFSHFYYSFLMVFGVTGVLRTLVSASVHY